MIVTHHPFVFDCEGSELVGIIEQPAETRELGVLIVTGGPQYRVGSHRQFVSIARELAHAGFAVMRFDYRGMGDSAGRDVGFEDCTEDLKAAIDNFFRNSNIQRVVLWGLCDAASACLIYGYRDSRVAAMVLLNPWVRTDEGLAQVYVKKYYLKRLVSREFWAKLLSGEMALARVLREFTQNLWLTISTGPRNSKEPADTEFDGKQMDFRQRMLRGFELFEGKVLLMLCGDDLTAAEFVNYARQDRHWRKLMRRTAVTQRQLEGMDHTFSTKKWRATVINETHEWLSGLCDEHG